MRRLPVLHLVAERKDQTPEALYELFWDCQRTQTQSSVTAFGVETANGCLVLPSAGPMLRGILSRVEHPGSVDLRALSSGPGTPVARPERSFLRADFSGTLEWP
jgi:non-ribosomal peptide synthetase component F